MTKILQDFSSSTSLTDNFRQDPKSTGTLSWASNVGLNGSGGILISTNAANKTPDQIWGTKQGYTISDEGVYTVSVFFKTSAFDNGHGFIGFSAYSQGVDASLVDAYVGVSFGAEGGRFQNNAQIDHIIWDNPLSNNSWYKSIFTVTPKGGNEFDLDMAIFNATSTGVVGSLVAQYSLTNDEDNPTRVGPAVTNVGVGEAYTFHPFFATLDDSISVFDDFEIELDGDVLSLDSGIPVVDLNGSADTINNIVTFYEVAGPDDGSAAVFFTTGGINLGYLDSPNLSNLKISIPISDIAAGDELIVGEGIVIDITGTSANGVFVVSGTSFGYAIADDSGLRTVTFTSLDGGSGAPAPITAYETALDTIRFNNTSDIPATANPTRVFSVTVGSAADESSEAADIVINLINAPQLSSATYDASTNTLVVTGLELAATAGAANDIDVSKLTLTGQYGAEYTLTSGNVEIDSDTQFTVVLNETDQINVEGLLNKDGTSSVDNTTFNIAAENGWNPEHIGAADLTDNGVTVSNTQTPVITAITYNAATGTLSVTGTNFVKAPGDDNDITVTAFTFTGEGDAIYTLNNTSDIEIDSSTGFDLILSPEDHDALNQIFNKSGLSSSGGTVYNVAVADDWNSMIGDADISAANNAVMVTSVGAPTFSHI